MSQDKRKFYRTHQPISAQYRVTGDFTAGWHNVRTMNFSAGGVRFKSAAPLEIGVLLDFHVEVPGLKEPLNVKGRVVWSQVQAAGVTENGVEFLDVGPDQQFQLDALVQFFKKSGS